MVHMLVLQGHRSFAYLRDHVDIEPFEDRRKGYAEAVERYDLIDRSPGYNGESGLTDDWLDQLATGDETAVVAENGALAEALRKGLAVRGLHVPEDVSVVVLEGTEPPDAPSWYTLSIPRKQIGRVAVDALVSLVGDPDQRGRSIVVPCSIVPGTTIAPARPRPTTRTR